MIIHTKAPLLFSVLLCIACNAPQPSSSRTTSSDESHPTEVQSISSSAKPNVDTFALSPIVSTPKKMPDTDTGSETDTPSPVAAPSAPTDTPAKTIRIGNGAFKEDLSAALLNDWLPPDTPLEIILSTDHQKETYVLFRVLGMALFENAVGQNLGSQALRAVRELKKGPNDDRSYSWGEMKTRLAPYENIPFTNNFSNNQQSHDDSWVYWLAKLHKIQITHKTKSNSSTDDTTDTEDTGEYQTDAYGRTFAILLLDCSFPNDDHEEWAPSAEMELKVRDMDSDGKPEAKVVFDAIIGPEAESTYITQYRTLAFIVDQNGSIQVQFNREVTNAHHMPGQLGTDNRTTVWQLKDLNGDTYPDLAVKRRWDVEIHQWECGEDIEEQPDDIKKHGTDQWDCLYSPQTDRWNCPTPPELNIYE